MAKKTRMSAVVDHSTMGLNLGTEMEITQASYRALRRALAQAYANGLGPRHCRFELGSGDALQGNAVFYLKYTKANGEENTSVYEFKQQGKRCFLNIHANPTCLMSGNNDVPVLVRGFEYGDFNAATITFKYLNRVSYALLDTLLAPYGFTWSGVDKRKLADGDIVIHKYQIAWYSGDLGSRRDDILGWLRVIYGSQDAARERVRSIGEAVGLVTRVWDNNNNLTVEAHNGTNRSFSLSWYAKDREPEHRGDKDRLSQLIRWDCTLNQSFLKNNRIATIRELETRYTEQCELGGYDVGFVRWIANKVCARLNFVYLLGLDVTHYRLALQEFEDFRGSASQRRVIEHWLSYAEPESDEAYAAAVGVADRSNFAKLKRAILTRWGLDVSIPRAYHEALLENRVLSMRTVRERGESVRATARTNRTVDWQTLVERDTVAMTAYRETLNNAANMIAVRRFTPRKVKPDEFWIYRAAA